MRLSKTFLEDVRQLICSARATAARGVDLMQVHMNFEIGRRIVEQEQHGKGRAAYGKEVIKALAGRLADEFGSGFSERNLAYMRTFYLLYQGRASKILQTASAKSSANDKSQTASAKFPQSAALSLPQNKRPFSLSWSHYVFLLAIKNPAERNFYEIEASSQGWTLRELKRQFNSSLYERLALSRDKKGIRKLSKRGQVLEKPQDMLKEPYVLEFLGLDAKASYSETDLETAIIDRIEHFLLELGKGFLFEARQTDSLLMRSIFLSIWFSIIDCCGAMCWWILRLAS